MLNSPQRQNGYMNTRIILEIYIYSSLCTVFSAETLSSWDRKPLSICPCSVPRHKLYYLVSVQKDGFFYNSIFFNNFYRQAQPECKQYQVIKGRQGSTSHPRLEPLVHIWDLEPSAYHWQCFSSKNIQFQISNSISPCVSSSQYTYTGSIIFGLFDQTKCTPHRQ